MSSLVPRELLLHRLVEVIAPHRSLLAVEQLLTQHLRAAKKFGMIQDSIFDGDEWKCRTRDINDVRHKAWRGRVLLSCTQALMG